MSRIKNYIAVLLLISSPTWLFSQKMQNEEAKPSTNTTYEITKTDITQLSKGKLENISVFNVKLGASLNNVQKTIDAQEGLDLVEDLFTNHRYYLYDKQQNRNQQVPIAYLKWNEKDQNLSEIIIYPGISKYLVGDTKKLVSKKVIDSQSNLPEEFIGEPNKEEVLVDIPSINLQNTAYYFPNKDCQVIKQKMNGKIAYTFGFFDGPVN